MAYKSSIWSDSYEPGTWSSMFPAIQHSEQGSADHVKMLIFVGFSCITFLRNIFPKEAYEIYNMDDVLVSLISEDNNRLCPKMFVELLYSAFEAIDKKYLRELSLVISDENCAIAQEVYTFSIQYHTNGNLSLATYVDNKRRDVNRKLHIKHSTLDLIQNIMMLTQSMSLLPKEITLCFYLSYYNNVTPKGYEPRGYSSVTSLNIGLHDTCFLQYGSVKTLFHSLQLYSLVKQTLAEHLLLKGSSQDQKVARANSERKKKTNNNVNHVPGLRCVKPRGSGKKRIIKTLASISSLPVTLVSCQKDVESPLIKLSSEWKSASQCETNDTTTKTHNVSKSTSVRYSCSPSIMVSELSGFLIQSDMNCPCGLGGEEDIMLLCNHCGFYQHGVCFGILNSRDIPMTHVCERCAQIGRSCTDSFLQKSSTQLVREFCTLRRIYAHLSKVRGRHTIGSLSQKFGLSRGLERRISAILKKEKAFFINDQPSESGWLINEARISTVIIPKYFHRNSEHETNSSGKETVSSVSNICHSYEVRGTASHNWTGKSRLIQNDVNDFCGFDSIDQIGENFSPKLYMYDDGKESYKDQVEKIDNENEIFCDYSKILQVIKHTPCSFEKDQICKINLSKFIVPYSSIQYREIQSVTIDNASIIFCEPLISNYFLPFATNDTPEHKEWTLISKVVVSGQESCNFITFKRSIVSKCEGLLEAASPERRLETVQPETGIRSNENSIVESTVCSLSFRDKGTSLCKNIQFDKVNRSLPVDSWYKSATLATSQLENQESSHKINGNLDMIKYLSGLENETSGIEMIRRIKIGNPESENEILELTCARNDHEGKEFIPFSSRATSLVNHSPSSTISSRLSGCSIFSVYPKSHVDVNDSVLNFQNKTSQENDSYKYEGHSSICTSRDEDKRSSSDGNILTFVKSHIPEFVYWKNSQQYEIEIEQEYPVIMSSLVLGANMLNSEVATRNCKKHFIENDNSLESKVFQSGICTSFLQKITQSEETHKRDESKRRETEIKQHKNEETYKKDKSKKRESEIKQQGKREANSCKERKAETSKSNTRKRENVSRKKEIRTKARENETKRRENRIKIKENDKKQKSVTEKRENETIIPKDEAKKIEGKSKINRQKRIRFQTERNYLKLQTPGIKAVTYWESRKDRDVDTLQNYNKEKNNVLNERKKGDSPEARKTTVIGKKKEENRVKKRVESNYNTGNEVNQREKYGINRISDLKRKKINETLIGTIEGSGALERRKIESIPIRDICKRGPHKIQCREREDKHIRKCFNVKSKMSKAQENCAKKYHDYNAHERKTGIVRKIYKGEKNKGKKIVFNTKEKSGHSTKTLEGFLLVKREESKHRRAEHNIQKKGKCENTAAKKPYAVNNETQTIKMGISDTSGKNKHDKYETTQTDNIRKRKSYEYSCKEDCPSKKRKIRSLEGERNGRSENCKVTEKVSDRKEKGHTEKEEENTVHSVVSTEYPFSDAVISNLEEPFDINDIPPTDEMKYDTLIEDRIQEKSKLFETKSMISHLNNRNSASLRKTYSCSKHKKRKILNSRYMKSKSREQNIYAKDNSARNKTTDFIIAKPDHVCTTKPASTNCKRRMRSYPKSVHWFDDVSSLNSNNKSIVCSKKKKNVSKSKSILKKRNYQEGLFSYHSDQKSQDNTDTNCPENQSTSTIIKKPTDRKNPKFFKSKFALESYISSLTCTSSAKCIPPQFFTRSKSFELLKHRYPPYTHGRDEERLNSCSNIPGISDVNNSSHPSLDTLQHEVLHPLIDNSPDWISPFHKDKLSRRSQELYDIFSEMDSHIKVPYKLFKMYRRKQSDAFKLSDSYCANCRKGFNQDLSVSIDI